MSSEPHSGQKWIVDLEPIGRRVEVEPGTNLLEAAQRAGVDLVASCGGIGICGTCRVRITQGKVTPVSLTEEESLDAAQLKAGFRLACQAEPLSDVRLDIPPESLTSVQQMQVEGQESQVLLSPLVVAVDLALEEPNLEDLRADLARVDEKLACQGYGPLRGSLSLLGQLSHVLRHSNWKARLA
ncbi:MAG: hypothetical protein EHM21_12925, partial [Chloroflexi bacterium]